MFRTSGVRPDLARHVAARSRQTTGRDGFQVQASGATATHELCGELESSRLIVSHADMRGPATVATNPAELNSWAWRELDSSASSCIHKHYSRGE